MNIAEKILRAKADYDAVFEAGKKAVGEVLKFTDVESTKYRTTVPSGVEPFARVNKIGGMTYKTDSGLISASVSGLKSEGANLIPFPYKYQGEQTLNGVTWNFTENGITASGTQGTSSSVAIYVFSSPITLNGTYTASINKAFPSNSSLYLTFDDNLGNVELLKQGNTVSTTTINNRKCTSIRLWITKGATFNGENYLFMLNEGTTALPYTKYKGTIDTLPIPEAIRSLDGYGLGVNGKYYNYIDYDRKVFVQNVYRKVIDGTEKWVANASSNSDKNRVILSQTVAWDNKFPIIVSSNSISPVISNLYNTVKADDTWVNVNGICINNIGELVVYDEAYNTSDISLWKSHLAELYASGNPLVIDYALAEPIETDISAYLTDEYIEVEGGGTITAVNEYGLDAPTNISYLIDTQGG